MLKKKETIVIHPVFGKIRLEDKFAKVLELKKFRDLAFKSQIGIKSISRTMLNTKHTRLMHSIGVMYLTQKLLDVCEKKFSKYFEITQVEKESLLLAALGHDLGHVAFSHSMEDRNMKTHEQRTIEYFQEYSDVINNIFGYDIVSNVLKIYKNNIDIKEKKNSVDVEGKLDVLFIFKSLLIGDIDCDRMEYITSDRLNVFGELIKFEEIFNYVTIVLLNDLPTVGFEKEAVPLIERMLLTRFDQYIEIYYDADSTLTAMCLKEYKEIVQWSEEEIVDISEYEIFAHMAKTLRNPIEKGTRKYRLAQIILEANRDDIMFKTFDSIEDYEYFVERLEKCIQGKDVIKKKTAKVTLYNPKKSKIYIKDSDGVIKDITEVSLKIKEISKELGYVMIDLNSTCGLEEQEVRDIKDLFLDNPVEVEKKFVVDKYDKKSPDEIYRMVEESLRNMPEVVIKDFSEWNKVENHDLYFQSLTELPEDVAMRYRQAGDGSYYFLKIKVDDSTSITKRSENKYHCESREEFLKLVSDLFKSKGYDVDKIEVVEGVRIITNRYKTLVEVQGSFVELACDFSRYEYQEKIAYGMMIECELKEGEDMSLWYLSNYLKSNGFIETNESKEKRAKNALGMV